MLIHSLIIYSSSQSIDLTQFQSKCQQNLGGGELQGDSKMYIEEQRVMNKQDTPEGGGGGEKLLLFRISINL